MADLTQPDLLQALMVSLIAAKSCVGMVVGDGVGEAATQGALALVSGAYGRGPWVPSSVSPTVPSVLLFEKAHMPKGTSHRTMAIHKDRASTTDTVSGPKCT